jgi:hypothetical protein
MQFMPKVKFNFQDEIEKGAIKRKTKNYKEDVPAWKYLIIIVLVLLLIFFIVS